MNSQMATPVTLVSQRWAKSGHILLLALAEALRALYG